MTARVPVSLATALLASLPWCVSAEDAPPPVAQGEEANGEPSEPELPVFELPPRVVRGVRIRPTDEGTAIAETLEVRKKVTQVESVSEVLSDAVGVQVRRLGGLGSYGTASIRGSTPAQVPVYLDGVLLNAGGFSSVNLGDLALDSLETIAIYRGAAPARFATAGIGGVISLTTRELKRPLTELALSYGSFDTARLFALHGDRVGGQKLLALVSCTTSAGDFTYRNHNGTQNSEDSGADDTLQRRQNNQHLAINGLLKLDGATGEWHYTLAENVYAKDQGLPGLSHVPTERSHLSTLRNSASLSAGTSLAGGLELTLDAAYLAQRELLDDSDGELVRGRRVWTQSATDAVGVGGLGELELAEDHRSTVRLEIRWERFAQRSGKWESGAVTRPSSGDKHRVRTGLALEHEWKALRSLALVPALRLELHNGRFEGGNDPGERDELDGKSYDELFWQPTLGGRWEPVPGLVLRANAGRYYRAPDLTELFGYRGSVVSNPDLEAETAWNVDLGLGYQRTLTGALDHLRLEVAGFATLADNLIVYEQNSQNQVQASNSGTAEIFGVESSLRLALWRVAALSANYTFLWGINRSERAVHRGKHLPGRPVHELHGKLELGHELDGWRFRLWGDVDFAGINYLDQMNRHRDSLARLLFGLGLRVENRPAGLTMTLEVDNLLNTMEFRDPGGDSHPLREFSAFPLPGRTVMFTMHWRG